MILVGVKVTTNQRQVSKKERITKGKEGDPRAEQE